jgi:glycyl-tRNA synthetase beta chain
LGCIIALADKLDTLAGIFSTGQKPSASKDPYALRRAALGVLRILIEGDLDLDLRDVLALAIAAQPGAKNAALVEELLQFHWDRLRGYYTEAGIGVEVFESVLATGPSRPRDIERRIQAVVEFRKLPEAEKLAAAHKRVRNILRQARERKEPVATEINRALAEPAELALLDALEKLQKAHPAVFGEQKNHRSEEAAAAIARYQAALKGLAALQAPLDTFFTDVMVMAEEPAIRANRLALLTELDGLCRAVVDISCLPG